MQGSLVRLRPLELEDIQYSSTWLAREDIGEIMGYFPMSLHNQVEWFKQATMDRSKFLFAICDHEDRYIGNVALGNINYIDRNADLSVFIADLNRRRGGMGSEAVKILLNFAFNRLNLHKIKVRTSAEYVGAVEFWTKIGFVEEGVLRSEKFQYGKFTNKHLFGMLREEFRNL